ncbi:MAG: protein kinase domain-containing protein [Chloroflexota bacterium]
MLQHIQRTELTVETFLARASDAPPAEITKASVDTRAWFTTSGGQAYFLKWVQTGRYEASLAKDVAICSADLHPAIVHLLNVVQTADGVLLVYEKAPGETLDRANRPRFFALPVATKLQALQAIFGALEAIVDAGWIMVDFYEGNVIYDFATDRVTIFDFELFERGDRFVLLLERNYGSRRLMAPEEWVRGAVIDQKSNVFTLGRYAINALSSRIDEQWRSKFQGSPPLADVLARATLTERNKRYTTVREFVAAFEQVIGSASGSH